MSKIPGVSPRLNPCFGPRIDLRFSCRFSVKEPDIFHHRGCRAPGGMKVGPGFSPRLNRQFSPRFSYGFWLFAVALIFLSFGWGTLASAGTSAHATPIQLASVHALVQPLNAGKPILEKFPDHVVPIASITKVMTAIVVLDSGLPLNEWLDITSRSDDPPKNAYSRIRTGSQATRQDLLRITLMSSENLAAYILARNHPGDRAGFVAAMNAKARELGMTQTRFVDPSGLWPENVSSARDIARMMAAAYTYPLIREMSTGGQFQVHFRNPGYTLNYGNTNALVNSARWQVHLSKTGYLIEAGRCLTMVAELNGEPMILVFLNSLGSRTPLGDAGRVRRWLETGVIGTIAGDALDYERTQVRALTAQLPTMTVADH